MARLTVIMTAVWVVFVIASPLPTSSAPQLQSSLEDESFNLKGPSPQQQDPPKASKNISNLLSSAPVVLQNSTLTLSTAPPLSSRVSPQSRKPNPPDEKDGGSALPTTPPMGVDNASKNIPQVSPQGNSRQSSTSLSGKASIVQSISKAQQIDAGKQSGDKKGTVKDESDKPGSDAAKSQEQSFVDIKVEMEGKNKSSENNSSKSPHPGLREDLGNNPFSDETVVSSANQSKSLAVPVSPTPVKPLEERQGGKDIPSAVSKGVTPSTTTTATTVPVHINNVDLLKPPLHNSFERDDEDEQPSSMVPGGVGIESSYQRPEELDPALPDVSRGDEKVVPQIESGGKFSDDEDSHFFAYFLTIMVTAIIFYLVFHNKQRIIALIIEGRAPRSRNRRSSSRARYHKLDNNLEEAMSGTKGPKYERIY